MSQILVVGVDMAKKEFAAASRVGKEEKEFGKFSNQASGYAGLHEQLKTQCTAQGLTQIHLLIEARPEGTRGYEAAPRGHPVAYAYENGWLVSMRGAPWAPKQVRDWAKGVGYRVKTDRAPRAPDARILAHYGVAPSGHPQPPIGCPLGAQLALEVSQLDSLLKRRLDLEQMLHAEETRLSELTGRPGMAAKVAESLRQLIAALTAALAEIQAAIDALCQSHTPFQQNLKRLLALPGVGVKTVLPLMVKLFQWHSLTSGQGDSSGLTAFVGLDPQPYESGGCPLGAVRKHPGISKKGDNEIRRLLYMGALAPRGYPVRGNNPLKAFYQRLVGRGKAKKLALVAAARKILVWAWTIFSRQIAPRGYPNPDFHQIGA